MKKYTLASHLLALAAVSLLAVGSAIAAPPNTLKIYLLTGQSNMVGHGYTYYSEGNHYNIPSLQFLLDSTPAATTYRANMPDSTFTFESGLNSSWMSPRSDVWGTHRKSVDNSVVRNTGPLGPGFGGNSNSFGPELGMAHSLGEAMQTPVFLYKSCTGGTTLAEDWRPPSAVAARGGSVGQHYTNTLNSFKAFLNTLDADLVVDGKLNAYSNAIGYEVAGLVWFQGWNEKFNNGAPEYAANIVDLVHDVRASDSRIPNNLGVIIPESSDQDAALNAGRQAAVATLNAEKPGTAVFFETNNMIGTNWGNSNSGSPFSTGWGYHFNAKGENYLEIGWRAGQAAIDNNFTGTDPAPEPTSFALLALGMLGLRRRRRRTA